MRKKYRHNNSSFSCYGKHSRKTWISYIIRNISHSPHDTNASATTENADMMASAVELCSLGSEAKSIPLAAKQASPNDENDRIYTDLSMEYIYINVEQ